MRVLSVTSELHPLVKTGGLADVAGALPPALARHGVEVRTLLPGYPKVLEAAGGGEVVHRWDAPGDAPWGGPAALRRARVAGLELYVLDAPGLYDRPGGPYADASGADHGDNWRRFAALARAGAELGRGALAEFVPDVVHAHDWQAGLVPAYLRRDGARAGAGAGAPSVVTVHNLAFQGRFDAGVFPALGLPPGAFSIDGVEYYGGVGFLKAGLRLADAVTTVSPTYAEEIVTSEGGMGLGGLLATRRDEGALHGIVNGIDAAVWDPAADPNLPEPFSAADPAPRAASRRALEARLGLDADAAPLFVAISRLTGQKGIDLLAAAADGLVAAGGKLAVLGTGEPALEAALAAAAGRHPGRIGVVLAHDEGLAHLMQGGGDAILVPSRFEPCGLTQLCGLRYGAVPVVARTGGLADTVIDANHAALTAGVATGLQFAPGDAGALARAVAKAVALHRTPGVWAGLRRAGMAADVSWDHSAAEYAALYEALAGGA